MCHEITFSPANTSRIHALLNSITTTVTHNQATFNLNVAYPCGNKTVHKRLGVDGLALDAIKAAKLQDN